MKRMAFLLILSMIFVAPGQSHPPVKVRLGFNFETRILSIGLPHHVKDAVKHRIDKVVVMLNGKEIVSQFFNAQTSLKNHEIHYVIPSAIQGDEIEVTATCNQYGKKKAKLTLKKSNEM